MLTIRALLDIGLPTTLMREVLPCTLGPRDDAACPALLNKITELRDDVQSRAGRLHRIEASLSAYVRANT